ncbi:MAG: DUF456 family protein [Thermoguttaceae bacterium]
MAILLSLLLLTVLLAAWLLTLLGLPGNWMMVVVAGLHAWLVPAKSAAALGWKVVVVLAVLAALGELLELLTGAAGTAKAGGTRRAALLALAGSIGGGLLGLFIGLPIPLIGPVIAAVLCAGFGAMAGAMLGEGWAGKNLRTSWPVGKAAFWGRLLGTLGKLSVGAAMIAVVIAALVF